MRTYPIFTSKYVFIRTLATGRKGTNGQMKPGKKKQIGNTSMTCDAFLGQPPVN